MKYRSPCQSVKLFAFCLFSISDYSMFTLAKLKILNHDPEYRTFVSRSIIIVLIRRWITELPPSDVTSFFNKLILNFTQWKMWAENGWNVEVARGKCSQRKTIYFCAKNLEKNENKLLIIGSDFKIGLRNVFVGNANTGISDLRKLYAEDIFFFVFKFILCTLAFLLPP